MFIHRQKQKGMVLICAVAILAVLSIMATSFVRMMTLNLQVAKNHLNYVDAKFAAIAGIENAKAKMWQYMKTNTTPATTFWYPTNSNNNLMIASRNQQTISLQRTAGDTETTTKHFSHSGIVGRLIGTQRLGRYEYNGNTYALKIQDNQGKLNLNSHHPYPYDVTINTDNNITYTKISDATLATRQMNSNTVMNKIIEYLAQQCGFDNTGNNSSAKKIANALRPKDSNRHIIYSLAEVENAIKSYGNATNRQSFLDNVCVISAIDSKCYTIEDKTNANSTNKTYINQYNTKYYREYRSPVNINTASKELIAALINAIEASVYIYKPTVEDMADSYLDRTESAYTYNIEHKSISFTTISKTDTIVSNLYNKNFKSMEEIENNIRDSTSGLNKFQQDTLICNFNPNVRDNFYNVDYTYALSVQKSNLLSYSTEFCIESYGHLKITSLGKITAGVINNSTPRVVSSALMEEIIAFGSLASSTTYGDFIYNKTADNNTFPYFDQEEQLLNRKASLGYIQSNFMTSSISNASKYCRVVHDGLLMKEMLLDNSKNISQDTKRPYRDSSNNSSTSPYKKFDNFDTPTNPFGTNTIFATTGTIKLWFKIADDLDTKAFCSLFSISHLGSQNEYISHPVNYAPDTGLSIKDTYYDGIQMYAYKNTRNQIRVSRVFFCSYWASESATKPTGINSLSVDVDGKYLPGNASNKSGKKRTYVRFDCTMNIENKLRPNEWNCLTITWDDNTQNSLSAQLWNTTNGTVPSSCYTHLPANEDTKPKFCLLNEVSSDRSRLTRFQLNGMDRHQYKIGTGDGRLFQIDRNLHLPGNTTINKIGNQTQHYNINNLSNYKVYIPLKTKSDNIDPNKNPLLNDQLKKISTWGDIGSINCISYDTSRKNAQTYATVEKVNPPVRISNQANSNLECNINLTHKTTDNLHPTVLDSITIQLLYPYVFSSSTL